MNNSGVYIIRNIANGRFYIGSTKNFKSRKSHIFFMLRNHYPDVSPMQKDWDQYGENSFVFEIVAYYDKENKWLDKEQELLNENFGNSLCYNKTPLARFGGNRPGHIVKRTVKSKWKRLDGQWVLLGTYYNT